MLFLISNHKYYLIISGKAAYIIYCVIYFLEFVTIWIYQCAESACPVFWKSPVRKEEIMVSDR